MPRCRLRSVPLRPPCGRGCEGAPGAAVRSVPAENPRPAPVITSARVASSRSASAKAVSNSAQVLHDMAFNFAGRLRVISPTASWTSYVMSA